MSGRDDFGTGILRIIQNTILQDPDKSRTSQQLKVLQIMQNLLIIRFLSL